MNGGAFSTADADQIHVRYNSGGFYEVQMPGSSWSRLLSAPIEGFPDRLIPASGIQRELVISASRTTGYTHSELAFWYDNGNGGYTAFGSATPASQIPVTGSATFNGIISGSSDVAGAGDMGGTYDVPVTGTVQLSFNFGSGSLNGSMSATLSPYYENSTSLGTFTFANTVYSAGSTHYSGQFNTSVSGHNFFLGQFTGPNAKETIGAWALPFVLSGSNHQAFGAWIAKK